MADTPAPSERPPVKKRSMRVTLRKRWRAWLRAFHRDLGYLAVGLTVVYAVSGIAINHLGDWDPNFKSVAERSTLKGPYPADEEVLTRRVAAHLGVSPDDVQASYYDTDTVFEVSMADSTARLDTTTQSVSVVSKEPRFMLRVMNWLHYNRGKAAWTYIADTYAVLLLYLALSGLFMLKGRKGFWGRGVVLVAIGAAVPIAYVQLAAGP